MTTSRQQGRGRRAVIEPAANGLALDSSQIGVYEQLWLEVS